MKLGLGTVQFGLDYGISNTKGKISSSEIQNILNTAKAENLDLLDTASLYGESETALGQVISKQPFKIVTKTPFFNSIVISKTHSIHLREAFHSSLKKLKRNKVYGLLIHNANDLLAEGGELLMDELISLKSSGLVTKIGVSIYDQYQIKAVIEKFKIDLIQVPINVLDQRLIKSGILKQLKSLNVEIHARSIFLQGLLLMPPDQIPAYFDSIRKNLDCYYTTLNTHHLSQLQGSLAFINSVSEIDYAVIGVTSNSELQEILKALSDLPQVIPDFSQFSLDDESMINPALWKLNNG